MSDRGGLMVVGATSGAGKSTVTAALCRALARSGRRVAPFKAQNMSNHAAVTDDGGEVGRAQAMQALAARVPLERRMNPILLKPTSDHRSHLVVMGEERSVTDAADYGSVTADLRATVFDALTSLRRDHDWVVAEGAGGAAEINLLDRDLVNLPLARAAGLPALLVVDIERGGAFASAHGTVDLLPDDLRSTIAGVIFNQFRGDPSLLDPGIRTLEARTGVPYLGTLPHLGSRPMLGVEDSLDVGVGVGVDVDVDPRRSVRPLRIAAIRLPHLANPFDFDPLMVERDVEFRWITRPEDVTASDLVILPGSRATVDDLEWLRATGLADALADTPASVVGICAGFQMMGTVIDDELESGIGRVTGLGLLDVETTFRQPKLVQRRQASDGRHRVSGYDIRFGRPTVGSRAWFDFSGTGNADPEGSRSDDGRCFGTSLHGLFDDDEFRHEFLGMLATRHQRSFIPSGPGWAERLDGHHDTLADWIEQHLPMERLLEIGRRATAGPGW